MDKTSIHGILACLVWLILLIGALFMRLLKGPKTWVLHASTQALALILFIASATLGIQLAGSEHQWDAAHSIIGIVLFATVWLLAAAGVLQHLRFRKLRRRTAVGVVHAWSARALITLAFVNGGLGLALAGGHGSGAYAAYGVVAAVLWLAWVGLTAVSLRREGRAY